VTADYRQAMDAEWSRAIFEVAKIGGPLLTAALYVLRAGFHKKWVWGWQLTELESEHQALQEKYDKRVAELEKDLRESLRLQIEANRVQLKHEREQHP
jgi:hypothetical protein